MLNCLLHVFIFEGRVVSFQYCIAYNKWYMTSKNMYNVTLPMNNEDYGVIDGTFNEKKRNSDIDKI